MSKQEIIVPQTSLHRETGKNILLEISNYDYDKFDLHGESDHNRS